MPYQIQFTDSINKGFIIVEDREINTTDTSLGFPGKGSTSYGQVVAENFLHLLENFASVTPPNSPVEGQLWYDTTVGVDQLKLYDGTNWVSASGLKKSATAPLVAESILGDLWVDTDNQQLYLNSGAGWILVGPEFSQGLATGPRAEQIVGTDDKSYTVLVFDINDTPVMILSSNEFTPKAVISGFTTIRPGLNLTARNIIDGFLKYRGVAESAESLRIGNNNISASNFLRGDTVSTSTSELRIRNNSGIRVGDSDQMTLTTNGDVAVIRSNFTGASLDLSVKNETTYRTPIRIKSQETTDGNIIFNPVGINNLNPSESLDVEGNVRTTGAFISTNIDEATTLNTGALQIYGGATVNKSLIVGNNAAIQGSISVVGNITGNNANISGFNSVTANTFVGNLEGSVVGTITGTASSANKLTNRTSFEIRGDVSADPILFDGSGDLSKIFNTTISNEFVTSKPNTTDTENGDEILINRTQGDTGLYKITKRNFLKTIPTNPIGMIVPYAGDTPPFGWLLCDGREVPKTEAFELWLVIGHKFKDPNDPSFVNSSATHFGLPDFRGRFALGADNMGGSSANRITDIAADIVGNSGGTENKDIRKSNIPEHDHDLRSSGTSSRQFYAIRAVPEDDETDAPEVQGLNISSGPPTTTGIPTSGGLRDGGPTGNGNFRVVNNEELGAPLNVVNPYLTVNYIIYAGEV